MIRRVQESWAHHLPFIEILDALYVNFIIYKHLLMKIVLIIFCGIYG